MGFSTKLANQLHQNCLYPRAIQSPSDALFVPRFIRLIHDLGTPNLTTIFLYGNVSRLWSACSTRPDHSVLCSWASGKHLRVYRKRSAQPWTLFGQPPAAARPLARQRGSIQAGSAGRKGDARPEIWCKWLGFRPTGQRRHAGRQNTCASQGRCAGPAMSSRHDGQTPWRPGLQPDALEFLQVVLRSKSPARHV